MDDGRLSCEVRGEVENEDGVLVIKRVYASHRLRTGDPETVRETVERVHRIYAPKCPLYRTLLPAFAISSSFEIVSGG